MGWRKIRDTEGWKSRFPVTNKTRSLERRRETERSGKEGKGGEGGEKRKSERDPDEMRKRGR